MPRQDNKQTEKTLDLLLEQWRVFHSVTDARAGNIRENVLFIACVTSEDSSAEWWNDFTSKFSDMICEVIEINNNIMSAAFSACGIHGAWEE